MLKSLHDAWWRLAATDTPSSASDSVLLGALKGASVLYRGAVALRNRAYDSGRAAPVRLACPVISVGNLTVGGTGKTTCVEALVRKLQGFGLRVGVLSRGYAGKRRHPYWLLHQDGRVLVDGQAEAQADLLADEPQLLAWHLPGVPIGVGPRRDETGWEAIERFKVDALILDDGFQHRRLARACDIVLISARMPLGGWRLLPAGPMREPLGALSRAHVIIITKADESLSTVSALREHLQSINPRAVVAAAAHEPVGLIEVAAAPPPIGQPEAGLLRNPDWLRQSPIGGGVARLERMPVGLLSSIGDPQGFADTIRGLGAAIVSDAVYPDHHRYAMAEVRAALSAAAAAGAARVITTEKDLMRLRPLLAELGSTQPPVWVLQIRMRFISGEDTLNARLAAVFGR